MRRLGAPPPPPPPKKIEDLASLNKFDKHTFLGVSMPMHYHQFIVLISPIIKLKFLGGGGGGCSGLLPYIIVNCTVVMG